MSQSTGMNQVPTSATNQQDSTPGGQPSPNYAPSYVPPTPPSPPPAAPGVGQGMSAGAVQSFQSPTPASNPFSDPQVAPVTPSGMFPPQAANPFSDPGQQQPPPVPASPRPVANPFTDITVPGPTGDYTTPTNQAGVFLNARGDTSPEMRANAARAVKLLDIAKTYGYVPNGQPALNQYAAGLLSPYTQYTQEKYAR